MHKKYFFYLSLICATANTSAAAQPSKIAEKMDYLITACQVVLSSADTDLTIGKKIGKRYKPHKNPMMWVTPIFALSDYYGKHVLHDVAAIKTTLLVPPKHGKIFTERDAASHTDVYSYDSDPSYTGKDNVSFVAEFERKRYKIEIDLTVVETPEEFKRVSPPEGEPVCLPKLTKIAK